LNSVKVTVNPLTVPPFEFSIFASWSTGTPIVAATDDASWLPLNGPIRGPRTMPASTTLTIEMPATNAVAHTQR
jgi:hypothetical protein